MNSRSRLETPGKYPTETEAREGECVDNKIEAEVRDKEVRDEGGSYDTTE